MLLAILLGVACSCTSSTFSLFVATLLLFLVAIIVRVVLVVIRILVFALFTAKHIIVQVKIVLKGIGNENIMDVLSEVHGIVDLIAELVLFFLFHVGAFFGGDAVIEDVEEAVSLDGLNDGPGLVGLLVLLLLLDLLLGRVLGLIGPRDGGANNALDLVVRVGTVDDLDGENLLSEVLILVEVELDD